MPKKSPSSSSRPRRGRPVRAAAARAGRRGGRGRVASGQRKETVVVKEGNSTALYAVMVAIVVVGLFLGTLLILDIRSRGNDSSTVAADQTAAPNSGAPTVEQLKAEIADGEGRLALDENDNSIRLIVAHDYLDLSGWSHTIPSGLDTLDQDERNANLAKSRDHYELVLLVDASNSDAMAHLGTIEYAQNSDVDKAVELYEEAIAAAVATNQSPLHAMWDKASLYTQVSNYSEAATAWAAVAEVPEIAGSGDQKTAQDFAAQMLAAAENATTTADASGAGE